jgi:hypothetical protein
MPISPCLYYFLYLYNQVKEGNETITFTKIIMPEHTQFASDISAFYAACHIATFLYSYLYCDVFPVDTSNNLRILDFMLDLLVMRQAEVQSIITIAVSL